MFSHIRLFCYPMECSSPGSSVHGIFQARILEWVAISFSRGSSPPGGLFTTQPPLPQLLAVKGDKYFHNVSPLFSFLLLYFLSYIVLVNNPSIIPHFLSPVKHYPYSLYYLPPKMPLLLDTRNKVSNITWPWHPCPMVFTLEYKYPPTL